uniref:Hemicentin-1 n=1 Tax=Clytia hemisphaerica TaxID=252671 RepID=A0A7M5X5Y5_9CNID
MAMRFTILYNVLFILLHLAGATDGSWTQWGSWSACTPQCYQTRKRTCTARICKNYDTDTQFCNAAGRSCSKWKADGSAPFTLSKCKHEEGRCLTGLRRRIQNKGVIYINDLTDSGVMESFSDCFELCQRIPGMTGCMYGKFKCWAHTQPLLPRYEESFKDPSHICWVKDICRKPLDGDWSQWGPWDVCRRPCFHGDQFRRRTCTNPAPQKGGRGCPESSGHHRMCNPNSCKDLDLHSSCKKEQEECLDESGRGHIQTMGKKLNHGKEKDCLEKCMDDLYYGSGCTFIKSTGYCYTHTKPVAGGNGDDGAFCWVFKKCKINGKWSKWGAWGECSVSCGPGGKQTRRRTCTNPIPNAGGLDCPKSDNDSQTRNCKTRICPTHGKWSQWGSWGKCSASCGAGQKTRTRTCTNPAPRHGGRECGDSNTHTLNCNLKSCPIVVHGKWSEWGSWGKCSASCGSGQKTRTRTCTNPAPQNGGRDCTDIKNDIENQKCNTNTCPNNNKVAEKVCKKQCSQLKGNCGQMLRCGDIELDVSNLCPETCAATTHGTNKDNNEVAEKFCKVKCVYLKSNCGQTLGCGETKFDVSNLCSETCAGTRGPKDNNQWAEKDCKVKCVYLKSNCGQLLECRRNTKWYISNLCPKTCATTNLGTKDNNEVAEKVCKMQCVHLKGKCGQMLKCGEAQLDVSNLCPKTCAATSHTTKDNNEVAENFCKKRCFHLIENCGQMVRCGDTKLDVSNLCPKTCATTTHGTKDNNELAEKICKKRCDQLERNCGEIKRCAGYTMLDVSNVCPETCAHKDNDKVAEKVCKKRCVHFKGNCGQMVKCGNTKFDVSNHCLKTCAATLCEPKKEAMVMCHGRSYTLHGKAKNGASAKQYEWYKKSKKDSLLRLDSDSQYSITYSDRDPTKSSLTILSFSMVKHEGLYAFREANLKYIDCYDYKVKGVLQVEYIDGKDMFDVVAGENINLQ